MNLPEMSCCSIPSDLGTFMMVDYIKNQLHKKTSQVLPPCGTANSYSMLLKLGMIGPEPTGQNENLRTSYENICALRI